MAIVRRGKQYNVGTTGYTLELTFKGYVVRCGGKEVATRMSRKAALTWIKVHPNCSIKR